MTSRQAYQAALLATIAFAVLGAILGLFDLVTWAIGALGLGLAALAAMVHLRTLVLLQRAGRGAPSAPPTAHHNAAGSQSIVRELQRSQAASESFILAELVELRQRVDRLIDAPGEKDRGR